MIVKIENTSPAAGTAGNVFLRGGMVSGATLSKYIIPYHSAFARPEK